MAGWQIGLVVLCVVGVAVITYGALADRARNRRRAAEMTAPPQRNIPLYTPTAVGPTYLSDLQARRPPEGTPEPADPVPLPDTPTFRVGFASRDFATDRDRTQAVWDHPIVCVCADPVSSVRELLGLLELASTTGKPVVILAPEFATEVIRTLEVNRIQGKVDVLAVTAPRAADWSTAAARSGATATERSDRQAGYLPAEHLGQVDRWISTRTASYLLTSESAP